MTRLEALEAKGARLTARVAALEAELQPAPAAPSVWVWRWPSAGTAQPMPITNWTTC